MMPHSVHELVSARRRTRTGPVMTIGNFDGVHRGHQMLLREMVSKAQTASRSSAAVIFDPHPLEVLRPNAAPGRLTSIEHRTSLLRSYGIDQVVILGFTREFANWEPFDFVNRVLNEQLDVAEVHVGAGFRFGQHAAGDVGMLEDYGALSGFQVHAQPLVRGHSSTVVRELVASGDMEGASRKLGRPHRLPVTMAAGLGAETNVTIEPGYVLPPSGWYSTVVTVDGVRPRLAATCVDRTGHGPGIQVRVDPADDECTLPSEGRRAVIDFVGGRLLTSI